MASSSNITLIISALKKLGTVERLNSTLFLGQISDEALTEIDQSCKEIIRGCSGLVDHKQKRLTGDISDELLTAIPQEMRNIVIMIGLMEMVQVIEETVDKARDIKSTEKLKKAVHGAKK